MCSSRIENKRRGSNASSSKTEKIEPSASGKSSSGHHRVSSRTRSSSRHRSSQRSRSVQRSPSSAEKGSDDHHDTKNRSRSRSAPARKTSTASASASALSPKDECHTPFDVKGRCHHHPKMQLAKKKLTGGWKVLIENCPKCMEATFIKDSSDNRSITSRRSSRSTRSNVGRKNPHRDDYKSSKSVGADYKSGRSVRVGTNVLPLGSISSSSRKREENRNFSPFDDKGYCYRHCNVRLAKKKLIGGWRILLDRCNECAADEEERKDSKSVCSRSSRSKSVCSRSSRHSRSKSVCSRSSRPDDRRRLSQGADTSSSTSASENVRKKSVKKMSYKDDACKEGLYTGYVNEQYKPHGRGKIVYQDGTMYSGTWMEGSKVHGKTRGLQRKIVSSRNDTSEKKEEEQEKVKKKVSSGDEFEDSDDFERQWKKEVRKAAKADAAAKSEQEKERHGARDEYANLYKASAKVVKDLPFIDLRGNAGKYTGQVNDKLMPHGWGCLTYDHGLVFESTWTNGFPDDDSTRCD